VLGVHTADLSNHHLVVELDGIPRADIVRALVLAEVAVETVMPRRRLEDAYLSLVEHDT
jgi:ABC-2 type transport system ATP-binding protein